MPSRSLVTVRQPQTSFCANTPDGPAATAELAHNFHSLESDFGSQVCSTIALGCGPWRPGDIPAWGSNIVDPDCDNRLAGVRYNAGTCTGFSHSSGGLKKAADCAPQAAGSRRKITPPTPPGRKSRKKKKQEELRSKLWKKLTQENYPIFKPPILSGF